MVPPIHVACPYGKTMQSRNSCLLYIPDFPEEVCEGHIIPSLAHNSLVSIGNICYSGFISEFKSQEVTIKRKGKIIIQVPRDRINGLCQIPLTA